MMSRDSCLCEYQEPLSVETFLFRPPQLVVDTLGDIELTVKVSPIILDREMNGIDVLSQGFWHDTTLAGIESIPQSRRLFGEVDVPALEEYQGPTPPFDNTRNNTLNPQNPTVVILLGWMSGCLKQVCEKLVEQERERSRSEEMKRLEKEAEDISKLLNQDFRNLQIEIERIRSLTHEKLMAEGPNQSGILFPGEGSEPTTLQQAGAEHGDGHRGDQVGPGEDPRPGPSQIPGNQSGQRRNSERQRGAGTRFHVEYKHQTPEAARSQYDTDTTTIAINLDHPQIANALRASNGQVESRQFREISYEVAAVEYAMALGHERLRQDEQYEATELLYEVRATVNRVTRLFAEALK